MPEVFGDKKAALFVADLYVLKMVAIVGMLRPGMCCDLCASAAGCRYCFF